MHEAQVTLACVRPRASRPYAGSAQCAVKRSMHFCSAHRSSCFRATARTSAWSSPRRLAAGTPVITTRATPWAELARTGRLVDRDGADALGPRSWRPCGRLTTSWPQWGSEVRQLIEERYTWPAIAQRMDAVYEWLTAGGPRPDDVWVP